MPSQPRSTSSKVHNDVMLIKPHGVDTPFGGRVSEGSKVEGALRGSEELRERIIRDLGSFTVALFALSKAPKGDHISPAGTGTLLTDCGSHYILTASHVWEDCLRKATKIGITVAEGIRHSFYIDAADIVPLGPPKPATWSELGPDMVLLRVPPEHIGSISARKVFYSPLVDGKAVPEADNFKAWVLMGTPEALTNFTENIPHVQIGGYFAAKDIKYKSKGVYDYFDLGVDISSPGMPKAFGGVSGGGLWRVEAYRSRSTGRIEWTRSLEGVAFFEFPIEAQRRVIRCHGPKSILSAIRYTRAQARE